jgi:hypothetical protein
MTTKRFFLKSLFTTFFVLVFTQNLNAGADWKEKQKRIFEQIPVKPGDVIDKSNWEKVKDLLPQPFLEHGVKTGDWPLTIAEFEYDYDFDPEYYELSAQNEGKYILGPKKEILDVNTGSFPMFIRGMPFPNVDVKNDPDGPVKFMHNKDLNLFMQGVYCCYTYPPEGNLKWVGRDTGYERFVSFVNEINYWWNRPGGEIPNPRELKQTSWLLSQVPFDLAGTATLYFRHLDGRADSMYCYVPAIRRVKRLSGANRSDPQMGSDQCYDDSDGFGGHIESMKWTFIGEKLMLKPIYKEDAKSPRKFKQGKTGEWENYTTDTCDLGYMKEGWTGAPWAYVNLVWVPREMWVFKAEPVDPYYVYGTLEIYVDKLSTTVSFNMKYTRAGEFWKYIVYSATAAYWNGGKKLLSFYGPSCVCDVKTDHASPVNLDYGLMSLSSPSVKPSRHSPHNLRTATK